MVRRVSGSDLQPGELPPTAALVFAPLHKRALGIALGLAVGLTVFGVTAVYLLRDPDPGFGLGLLNQYFAGYDVTWLGAVIGFGWGFFVGFVAGWFAAFCRNLVMALSLFVIRVRSDLAQSADFLDHI